MPNVLKITVENPDELLNAGAYDTGAVIQVQSSVTETQPGTFADLTGTGSTPTLAIVAGTRIYTAYDPNGTSATWYRTRYRNAAATRASDWTASFQVAEESAGLICSLYDVKQALKKGASDTGNDEEILEYIRQVTDLIQHYTGRRFVRRPSSGTTTFLFDMDQWRTTLRVPRGIATATLVEYATQTGGSYTALAGTDWFLDPSETGRDYGWPATRIVLNELGALRYFYPGRATVRVTMAEGFAAVPGDVEAVGLRAVVNAFLSKGSGGTTAAIGPSGAMTILRHISPADKASLDRYAVVV